MATKLKYLDEMPEILTAQHMSDYLQLSRRRIYELIQTTPTAGGIPSFAIGGSKRVKKESFKNWIDVQEKNKRPRG